jgi:hypothetical protein
MSGLLTRHPLSSIDLTGNKKKYEGTLAAAMNAQAKTVYEAVRIGLFFFHHYN